MTGIVVIVATIATIVQPIHTSLTIVEDIDTIVVVAAIVVVAIVVVDDNGYWDRYSTARCIGSMFRVRRYRG